MDKTSLIIIVSVLLVMVVTGLGAFFVSNGKSAQRQRMLSVVKGGGNSAISSKKEQSIENRREALARKLKETSGGEKENKKGYSLPELIQQAGLNLSVKKYWIYSFVLSFLLSGLSIFSGKGLFVTGMAALIGLLGVPKFLLKQVIKRRQKKFLEELADALDAMVRLLKAGMPVSEAIKMVAREYSGPVGEEMGRIFDQQKIGVSLPDAVLGCARRIPLTEVQIFATAVSIQAQTGSSLSEVFENLSRLVRSRFRLKRKVAALSAEAKSSAWIIGCLPVFVATAIYFINPDYIGLLFYTPRGKILLAGAIFWMCCGILVMKQMINFKV